MRRPKLRRRNMPPCPRTKPSISVQRRRGRRLRWPVPATVPMSRDPNRSLSICQIRRGLLSLCRDNDNSVTDPARSMTSTMPVSWKISWRSSSIIVPRIITPSPPPVCGRHRATNGVARVPWIKTRRSPWIKTRRSQPVPTVVDPVRALEGRIRCIRLVAMSRCLTQVDRLLPSSCRYNHCPAVLSRYEAVTVEPVVIVLLRW